MGDVDDIDNPEAFLRKKGECTVVKATLSPEKEDQMKKSIQKKVYFGGSVGTALLTVLLPLAMLFLHFKCSKDSCTLGTWSTFEWDTDEFYRCTWNYGLVLVVVFVGFHLPVGSSKLGEPMLNGDREKYRMRMIYMAFICGAPFSIFAVIPFFLSEEYWPGFQYNHIYDNFQYYLINAIVVSLLISTWLYKKSFKASKFSLNIHGNTGSWIYDFFMGREVNPRSLGSCHIKPMIMGLSFGSMGAICVALFYDQFGKRDGFGSPTLLLALFGYCLIATDYGFFEENYLTTMTMKHDGAGFQFVFLKLVLTPMLSTYHARYIIINHHELTNEPLVMILFGCVVMCVIWNRFINADKALFTRDKDHPEVGAYNYILASNGKRLLIDGWWSGVRHPNYICSICLSLACCVVTGFSGILPYIYFVFQVIYYVHRVERAEDLGRFEYGEAWDVYCKKVPFKLIRFVY